MIPARSEVVLTVQNGDLVAEWSLFTWRFLFADGSVLDVVSPWDTSSLREAVLKYRNKSDDRIEGVARLSG